MAFLAEEENERRVKNSPFMGDVIIEWSLEVQLC